jgi:sugar/nucleoside kinase (ribokinase family)
MEQFCGGKEFNQAIALRRAGNEVYFAGANGEITLVDVEYTLIGFGQGDLIIL